MAPLLLTMGSLTSRILMVLLPLKWVCMQYLPQIFLMPLHRPCIMYNYMAHGFNFIGSGLGACSALVVSPIIDITGGPIKPFLHPVQSPLWVFTLGECLPKMTHIFAEKLRIATHCFGPVGEGINYTKFC